MQKKNKSNKGKTFNTKGTGFLLAILSGVFVLSLVAIGIYTNNSGENKEKEPISYANEPSMREVDAPVIITEFADFKCPYCKQWKDDIFTQLEKDYIATGKVRFYFKNYAFIAEDSLTAAAAGEAIYRQDPNAFWDYYETMFKHQGDERTAWANKKSVLKLVEENIPSIDTKLLSKEMGEREIYDKVMSDNKQARDNNIQSTPSILINGELVTDPHDYENLKTIIDAELEESALEASE